MEEVAILVAFVDHPAENFLKGGMDGEDDHRGGEVHHFAELLEFSVILFQYVPQLITEKLHLHGSQSGALPVEEHHEIAEFLPLAPHAGGDEDLLFVEQGALKQHPAFLKGQGSPILHSLIRRLEIALDGSEGFHLRNRGQSHQNLPLQRGRGLFQKKPIPHRGHLLHILFLPELPGKFKILHLKLHVYLLFEYIEIPGNVFQRFPDLIVQELLVHPNFICEFTKIAILPDQLSNDE